MSQQLLLTALREHLVGEGIVRKPAVAGPVPPCYVEPRDGCPAPGQLSGTEQADVVVALFASGGFPARPFESWWKQETVDVYVRAKRAPDAFPLADAIRSAVVDRRGWVMDALPVVESLEWRPLQRLGSDDDGWTFVWSGAFQTFADPAPSVS